VNNLHNLIHITRQSCESRLSRSSCRTCRASRARHVERVKSRRAEMRRAKWNLGYTIWSTAMNLLRLGVVQVTRCIGGATPTFLGGPNLRPTQSITSFSTQDD